MHTGQNWVNIVDQHSKTSRRKRLLIYISVGSTMSTKLIRFHQTAKWNQNTKGSPLSNRQRHNVPPATQTTAQWICASCKIHLSFSLFLSFCLILLGQSQPSQIPVISFSTLAHTCIKTGHAVPTACRIALTHFCQFSKEVRSDFSNGYSPTATLNKSLSQAFGSQTRPSDRIRGRAQARFPCFSEACHLKGQYT